MKTGLKLIFITLPLVLLGVGFLAYTVINKKPPERVEISERATAVRIIVTEPSAVAPQATGYGLVNPGRTYEAIAQVGGTAEYVNPLLKKGAILPAGSVLLRLSPADFNLAIAQARANIRAAEARLAEFAVSESNLAAALEIEQETFELKAKDLERVERLFTAGTASQTARDGARAAMLAQRQKVLNLESSLALLPTQKAVQSEQIAVYQTTLETATLNLERTELTMPFAARVASVTVEVGQFVRVGQTAAILDGIDSAEVDAQISVADLMMLLRIDDSATSSLPFDPSAMTALMHGLGVSANVRLQLGQTTLDWPAALDRISDTIDQKTGTIGVIVKVDNAYSSASQGQRPPLTKGMFVEVTLNAQPVQGTIIPRSAIRNGQVMIADKDNRLAFLPVQPYLVRGEIALVKQGLAPDARVIVSSPSPIVPGMLLNITHDDMLMEQLTQTGRTK
ncbi:MAG: hypothetical protein L3J30_09010 [Marinosulfonomonas sp.]|nr:hypothetical protein [Marinosulfonomonas sp.]